MESGFLIVFFGLDLDDIRRRNCFPLHVMAYIDFVGVVDPLPEFITNRESY